MEMLEAADRAYAQKVFEEEEMRLKELNAQEMRDAEIARKFQEEMDQRAQERERMNQQLNIQRNHMRSSSIDDSDGLSRRATARSTQRKKKFASTVNVGERIKLHSG